MQNLSNVELNIEIKITYKSNQFNKSNLLLFLFVIKKKIYGLIMNRSPSSALVISWLA